MNTVTTLRAGRSRVRIPAGGIGFSLLQNVQTGSGAHQTSHSTGIGGFFPVSTVAGAPPFRVDVKNMRSHTYSHPCTPSQRRLLLTKFFLYLCTYLCIYFCRLLISIYLFIHSPIYSFIQSFIHSFIGNIHFKSRPRPIDS